MPNKKKAKDFVHQCEFGYFCESINPIQLQKYIATFISIFFFQELRHVDYTQYWNPKLMVLNVEGTPSSERSSYTAKPPVEPAALPMMVMRKRIKGIFRENLELEHFPFDVQVCYFSVHSAGEYLDLVDERIIDCTWSWRNGLPRTC